jgi:DNA polymerase III subunit alpha
MNTIMARTLVIDFETSGLPNTKGYKFGEYPKFNDLKRWSTCRAVELATSVCDEKYNDISNSCWLINVGDDVQINPYAFQMHGISSDMIKENGLPFNDIAEEILKQLKQVNIIISHNTNFDINVLKSELFRINRSDIIEEIDRKRIICTMTITKPIMNIKTRYGLKSPNLGEMYEYFVGDVIHTTHRANNDVRDLLTVVRKINELYPNAFN